MDVYLIGTPENGNIGDLAIEYFSKKYLMARFPDSDIITVEEFKTLPANVSKDDIFYFQGGGNIGDIYSNINTFRLQALERFKDNKEIILPQTIQYLDESNFLNDFSKIKDNNNLEIHARDGISFQKLCGLPFNFKKFLSHDMVDNPENFSNFRHSAMPDKTGYCFRNDVEQGSNVNHSSNISMMYSSRSVKEEDREKIVLDKINEINGYSEIYTDRLHCFIIAHNLGIKVHWKDTAFNKLGNYIRTWHV